MGGEGGGAEHNMSSFATKKRGCAGLEAGSEQLGGVGGVAHATWWGNLVSGRLDGAP